MPPPAAPQEDLSMFGGGGGGPAAAAPAASPSGPAGGHPDDLSMFGGAAGTTPPPTEPQPPSALDQRHAHIAAVNAKLRGHEPVMEALQGFGNAALGTVQTLASPIRKLTGMAPATPPEAPGTTAAKVGAGVEQVGEFLVPEALAGKVSDLLKVSTKLRAAGFTKLVAQYRARAVEGALKGAGAYATASHQGASTGTAAATGAIAGVSPVAGQVATDLAPSLISSAKAGMAKVLGAGKNISSKGPALEKDIAKAVPAAMELPMPTSWKDWATAAKMGRRAAGEALENAKAGPAGDQLVRKQPVIDALDDLVQQKATHLVPPKGYNPNAPMQGAAGGVQPIVFNPELKQAAQNLKDVLQQYPGDTLQARQIHDIKKMWDAAVYTGGEGNQLGFQVADRLKKVDNLAKLTATNAIRSALDAEAPTIAGLDEEVSRQIKLHQVIRQAAMARQQTGITGRVLSHIGTRAAGATIGGIVGEHEGGWTGAAAGALLGSISGRMLKTAIENPMWVTVSPMAKQAIADAIISGKAAKLQKALTPVLAGMTAQIGGHVPPPTQSTAGPSSSGILANTAQPVNNSAAGTPITGAP